MLRVDICGIKESYYFWNRGLGLGDIGGEGVEAWHWVVPFLVVNYKGLFENVFRVGRFYLREEGENGRFWKKAMRFGLGVLGVGCMGLLGLVGMV